MLVRLFSYHQVNPSFLNFLWVFGVQDRPQEFRFSGFRTQRFSGEPVRALKVPELDRSGYQYQISYNLKTIGDVSPPSGPKEWARRQCAIYHQFDLVHGTALWVSVSAYDTLKRRVQELLPDSGFSQGLGFENAEMGFKTSLAVHLIYCEWSMENWRWYIQWLETMLDEIVREPHLITTLLNLGLTNFKSEHAIDLRTYQFTWLELQKIQAYEDRVNEAHMILETNGSVLQSLQSFYQGIVDDNLPWAAERRDSIANFASQLTEMGFDLKMHLSRAQVLSKICKDRKLLVSLAFLCRLILRPNAKITQVQHRIQDQATRKMEALTENMKMVSEQSQREAVIMRIITLITLIYLPATFVSVGTSSDYL
jgi:hypothetical protein